MNKNLIECLRALGDSTIVNSNGDILLKGDIRIRCADDYESMTAISYNSGREVYFHIGEMVSFEWVSSAETIIMLRRK